MDQIFHEIKIDTKGQGLYNFTDQTHWNIPALSRLNAEKATDHFNLQTETIAIGVVNTKYCSRQTNENLHCDRLTDDETFAVVGRSVGYVLTFNYAMNLGSVKYIISKKNILR